MSYTHTHTHTCMICRSWSHLSCALTCKRASALTCFRFLFYNNPPPRPPRVGVLSSSSSCGCAEEQRPWRAWSSGAWSSGALDKTAGGGEWALPGSGGSKVEALAGHSTGSSAGESAQREQQLAQARRRFIRELIPTAASALPSGPSDPRRPAGLAPCSTDSPAVNGDAKTRGRGVDDPEERGSGGKTEGGAGRGQAVYAATPHQLAGRVVALHHRCMRCARWAAWGPPAQGETDAPSTRTDTLPLVSARRKLYCYQHREAGSENLARHVCRFPGCPTQARRDSSGRRLYCLLHSPAS